MRFSCISGGWKIQKPKKKQKNQRPYDKDLYQLRHLVENAFRHFKRWRNVASRYAKNASYFQATIQTRSIAIWANISRLHYLGSNTHHFLGA
jgi:transposase